jgi:hypothetical protein
MTHCSQCGEEIEQEVGRWVHIVDKTNIDPEHCTLGWTNGIADMWTDNVAEPCIKAGCKSNAEAMEEE